MFFGYAKEAVVCLCVDCFFLQPNPVSPSGTPVHTASSFGTDKLACPYTAY